MRSEKAPKTLLEELVDMGENAQALREAARVYYDDRRGFGEYLVSHGVVPSERVLVALARQDANREDLARANARLAEASERLSSRITATLLSAVTTVTDATVMLAKAFGGDKG